jgi:hypothetical protein
MNSSNDKKSPKEKSDRVSQLIKAHIKAHFTLGVGAKRIWGQFWAFLAYCLVPSY